jgi:tape measure domain-containing protein
MDTVVGQVSYIASIDTSKLRADADKAENIVEKTGSNIESSGRKSFSAFSSNASGAFDSVATGIGNLAKVATGLFIGGAFGVGAFVKQASELQGIRASFESMTGSAEEAEKVLRQLNKFSFETAFSTIDINNAGRAFLGAGLAVDDLGTILKQVGDIAGATGADLGQLTRPLTQSLAKGKLDTEDYYQILDSGAGKLGQVLREEVAKRGLGEISKAFQEGKVTSDILFDSIAKASAEGGFAFEGAIKQSKTFAGQMSNLQETIGGVALELLGVDKATGTIDADGVFARISNVVQDATKWLNENKESIKGVANFIIDNAIPTLAALAVAFTVAKLAAIGFSIAASVNPIGLIALAITALVAGLTFLEVKFGLITKAIGIMSEALSPVVDIFVTYFLPIINQIAGIVGGVLIDAFNQLNRAFNELSVLLGPIMPDLKTLGIILGVAVITPFLLLITVIGGAIAAIVGIVTAFAFVVGKVSGFVADLIKTFRNLYNSISGLFVSIGNTISESIVAPVRSAINGLLRWSSNVINGFIDAINGVVNVVNAIPGVNIGNIGRLPVPQLANGGIVTSPTLAMIGEGRESEAVIPLSKLDRMINGESGNNSRTNITINMTGIMARSKADERDIAKSLITRINEELKAKGQPLLGGGNI